MFGRKPQGQIVDFAARELGLTLTATQADMLSSFEVGGYSTAIWQCGRRGGKSLLADVVALFDCVMRDGLRDRLRPGELRVAAVVAPRQEQATAHIRNCRSLIQASPRLGRMLVQETTDSLTFSNGSALIAYPCSARGIRGQAWSCAVLDECAHFVDATDGPQAADRILEAAWPSISQFGNDGWLMAISTPRWRSGAFWRLCQDAQSERFPRMHYAHHSSKEMNPAIPSDFLEDQRRRDPELFAREYLAEFTATGGAYLNAEDVIACQRPAGILQPRVGCSYVAAMDPGFSQDAFTLGIAHRDEDQRVVVDGVWAWQRPGFESILDEIAGMARAYLLSIISTDQHCAPAIREGLERRGLPVSYEPWTTESKAAAFGALKVALNMRNVELPQDAALVEELCALEAKPTPAGYVRIAAASTGHDDRAVVLASVVHRLIGREASTYEEWMDSFGYKVEKDGRLTPREPEPLPVAQAHPEPPKQPYSPFQVTYPTSDVDPVTGRWTCELGHEQSSAVSICIHCGSLRGSYKAQLPTRPEPLPPRKVPKPGWCACGLTLCPIHGINNERGAA